MPLHTSRDGTTEAAVTHQDVQDERTELQIDWDAGNPVAGRPGLGLTKQRSDDQSHSGYLCNLDESFLA